MSLFARLFVTIWAPSILNSPRGLFTCLIIPGAIYMLESPGGIYMLDSPRAIYLLNSPGGYLHDRPRGYLHA